MYDNNFAAETCFFLVRVLVSRLLVRVLVSRLLVRHLVRVWTKLIHEIGIL